MSTQRATEARSVDWSFPMNPSHLPPKSPGSFSSFGAGGPVESSAAGRTTLPSRAGNHKRTPSAGFLAHTQPTWMDGVVDVPELGPFKRGAHRRSASESMAFLDGTNFSKMVDDNNMHEDDDYESRSVASMHSGGGSVDFDRLDEDPFLSMFGNEGELTPKRQHCNGRSNDPASPSDSNSMSEISNDDLKGGLGKDKSEPDVQSSEGGTQSLSKGELQQALAGLDSSLDPKRAKRILANRQSAQRSRVRKLQYISELERSVTALQSEISSMAPQVAFFEHRRAVLNVDNNSIKQKMGALLQGQLFKDAHNEALQKEVQRLRQLYQQQQQNMQQQQDSQLGVSSSAYDLQHQQFNKQESGATSQAESTLAAVPNMFASGLGAGTELVSSSNLSPTRFNTRPLPHSLNAIEASTW